MSNILENIVKKIWLMLSKMIRSGSDREEENSDDIETHCRWKLYIDMDKSTSDIIRMIIEGELICSSIIRENLFGTKRHNLSL